MKEGVANSTTPTDSRSPLDESITKVVGSSGQTAKTPALFVDEPSGPLHFCWKMPACHFNFTVADSAGVGAAVPKLYGFCRSTSGAFRAAGPPSGSSIAWRRDRPGNNRIRSNWLSHPPVRLPATAYPARRRTGPATPGGRRTSDRDFGSRVTRSQGERSREDARRGRRSCQRCRRNNRQMLRSFPHLTFGQYPHQTGVSSARPRATLDCCARKRRSDRNSFTTRSIKRRSQIYQQFHSGNL